MIATSPKLSNKEVAERWEAFRLNLLRDTPVPTGESEADKKRRIQRLLGNFEEFCKYYWPNYCSAPFAKFHLKFAKKVAETEVIYIVRAWAREHAKSVVAGLFVPLFEMFNGRLKNMLLVSHSYDNACELLMPLMLSLESNQRLLHDFGPQKGWRGWEMGNFATAGGCAFRALGAGQSPRGSRNEEFRPDFILVDDIDTDEESRNEARQKKKWDWIEQALFPTMSISGRKRFVFVGNIISKTGIIARASEKADDFEQINILDKKGLPSWKERYTLDQVNYMLSKISYASGQKEYFNNPISEGTVFKDITWGKVPPLSKFQFLVCYTDPSFKDSKKNDYKATVLIGELEGSFYILRTFVEQTTTAKMIEWHYDLDEYVGGRTATYYYMEANFLQDIFLEEFRKAGLTRGKFIPVAGDDRAKPDKFSRIEANLEPLNRQGRLIFNEAERESPHMTRLVEQFKALEPSLPGHDDGPDATEGGVWMINNKLKRLAPIKVGHDRRKSKKW